ncbi:ATP-binding protein [Streptomyces sp. BPTC-684]|uniref:ATP-binding protein n=1 Tax=Streptomyces sp. BPTC-684 TaxID=3043734 RepID=UPI0024B265CF|nr:ATP-binding protein [Streptomyces sp. BPTC-684]WHM36603.1 ATP-binding protein [Streptomyces sp. BPTC-684]
MSTRTTLLVYTGKKDEVALARRQVVGAVRAWDVPLDAAAEDTIRLVTSELVTNAVQHTDGPVTVVLYHQPGHLVIDVLDHSPTPPLPRTAGTAEERGRGLELVDALATSTGWEPTQSGKRVWALLKVPASAPTQRATVLRQFFTRPTPTRPPRALALADVS